jgi:hypothetical protein
MNGSSKNSYPKAIGLRSPDELASINRLSQLQDELTAQAKKLKDWKGELEQRSIRLRRWCVRLTGVCILTALIAAAAVWYAFNRSRPIPVSNPAIDMVSTEAPTIKVEPPPQKKIVEFKSAAKVEPKTTSDSQAKTQKAAFLEALGGLSVTHLYQSHLNIGLLADGVESETYSIEEADRNLQSVVELMKHVDAQHAKLVKTGLDREDQDSIREIQAVSAMLRLQVDSLRGYWSSDDAAQANQYHAARKATWQGLTKVMGLEK